MSRSAASKHVFAAAMASAGRPVTGADGSSWTTSVCAAAATKPSICAPRSLQDAAAASGRLLMSSLKKRAVCLLADVLAIALNAEGDHKARLCRKPDREEPASQPAGNTRAVETDYEQREPACCSPCRTFHRLKDKNGKGFSAQHMF
jgi:hypothetical protein